jgi:hypothetical protein
LDADTLGLWRRGGATLNRDLKQTILERGAYIALVYARG